MWLTLVLVGLLFARMPEALTRPEFWADDAVFYSEALADGVSTLLRPYEGYLIVAIRAVAAAEALVSPQIAPLVGSASQNFLLAAAAAIAARGGMPWSRRKGVLIAVGIVLLPASFQIIGTASHLMWAAALALGLLALSPGPKRRLVSFTESAALVVAGLTGLGSILLLPLFIRGPRHRLTIIAACGLVQLVFLATGLRRIAAAPDLVEVPAVYLERAIVVPILGPGIGGVLSEQAVLILGSAIGLSVILMVLNAPTRPSLSSAYLLVGPPIAALMGAGYQTAAFADASYAPRYFWLCGVAFIVLLVITRLRTLAIPLTALIVIGMVAEFRIQPAESMGWRERSACIGGPSPCEVPIAPNGRWRVIWDP